MPKPQRLPDSDEQARLQELRVDLIGAQQKARWDRLVRQHHYLKSARLVGEQLRYVVTDARGRWLALIGWSAPALHLKARDQSLAWTADQRQARLHFLAQNSRYVILADRQALPNLATRAMALCLQRLSDDWQQAYGHPIVMVESFVDRQLFRATAYKAGGWQALGFTADFKRVNEDFFERHDRPKQLWVKALSPHAWAWLRAAQLPPSLARYEKAVPPVQVEAVVLQWQDQMLGAVPATDAVVIDGKEVRGGDVMLVNAVAQPSQRVLGVEPVPSQSNEIPTARTLIERLDLPGRLVQLDGMHTQHQTVQQLLYEKGADYSLILRDNQPNAASVLGLFRRLSNALKERWAKGRPKRKATSRDWLAEHHCDRWLGIRLFTRPTPAPK